MLEGTATLPASESPITGTDTYAQKEANQMSPEKKREDAMNKAEKEAMYNAKWTGNRNGVGVRASLLLDASKPGSRPMDKLPDGEYGEWSHVLWEPPGTVVMSQWDGGDRGCIVSQKPIHVIAGPTKVMPLSFIRNTTTDLVHNPSPCTKPSPDLQGDVREAGPELAREGRAIPTHRILCLGPRDQMGREKQSC